MEEGETGMGGGVRDGGNYRGQGGEQQHLGLLGAWESLLLRSLCLLRVPSLEDANHLTFRLSISRDPVVLGTHLPVPPFL